MPRYLRAMYVIMSAAGLSACAKDAPVVAVNGECADVYHAQVCTWARTKGDSVVDVGAIVPVASIENAPLDAPPAWPPASAAVLPLPAAVQQKTGLTHLTMYWESMGHPPGPYLTPHFDFHFYSVRQDERSAMDCADLSKPSALPSLYSLPDVALPPPMAKMTGVNTLVGLCVPQMGMHALPAAALADTNPMRATMVIGYYKGKPIFVEPMVSRAMLMEKKAFDLPIPSIPGMRDNYPRSFRAEYDAQQKAYRFVFSDFGPRT